MAKDRDSNNTNLTSGTAPAGTAATSVDMGSDLLEASVTLEAGTSTHHAQKHEQSVDELYANAVILLEEGLLEEARKTLRQVLKKDPKHILSRKKLEEVFQEELKILLSKQPMRSPPMSVDQALLQENITDVLARIDKDLGWSLLKDEPAEKFIESQEFSELQESIEKQMDQAPLQDRIDLAIGFLEMGLFGAALKQTNKVIQDCERGGQIDFSDHSYYTTAQCLKTLALIENQQAFEALLILQTLLKEQSLSTEVRTELSYLMGRAHERLSEKSQAIACYRQVEWLQPGYRDVSEKLRMLLLTKT